MVVGCFNLLIILKKVYYTKILYCLTYNDIHRNKRPRTTTDSQRMKKSIRHMMRFFRVATDIIEVNIIFVIRSHRGPQKLPKIAFDKTESFANTNVISR